MPRTDCLTDADLKAFLLGDLPETELLKLGGHMETCPRCEAAVAALDGVADHLVSAYRRAGRAQAADDEATLPERVGDYQVLEEIGRGGMGVVYRARHVQLRRTVALKVLRGGTFADPEERRRFRAEAESVARLQHPHVVQIFDVGEWRPADGGPPLPYIALEFVEGGSLAARTKGQPQPPRLAAAWLATLARALHHAHGHGLVHRDVKPSNVLLTPDGQPKLCDFGIAKDLARTDGLTTGSAVVGTAEYMAPEQVERALGPVGPATDVYALGVVLYELLTGKLPFRGASPVEVLLAVRRDDPARPREVRRDVPRDLEAVCLKCLHKDARRRYATAADLADDLDRFLNRRPVRARPPRLWERPFRWLRRRAVPLTLAAAGLAVVLTLVAWAVSDPTPPGDPTPPVTPPAQSFPEYLHTLSRAEKAWRIGQFEDVGRIMEECSPENRDWEWYHLRRKY